MAEVRNSKREMLATSRMKMSEEKSKPEHKQQNRFEHIPHLCE